MNEPQATACACCGFTAFPTGEEIAAAEAEKRFQPSRADPPSGQIDTGWLNAPSSVIMFFPEGLVAAALVLASPIWFLKLLFEGKLLAAFILCAGVAAGVWLARQAWVAKERWLLYCAVVLLLLTAAGTFTASR